MCGISDRVVEAILKAGSIYEVGGAVRDKMMNRNVEIKDRDYLVCGIPYRDLTKILERFGQVDLVGRSFGVIKFTEYHKESPRTFDIALPRKEYSTGIGHRDFSVTFDPDLRVEDDLLRRDFTINAMAVSLKDNDLIDPYGGMNDLKNRKIRIVSPNSFPEDPLRMLRAVQFAARFEFEIEPETLASIKKNAEMITSVSQERISEELNKMLVRADRPSIGFRLMERTGLLQYVIPEMMDMVGVDQPGGYHRYDVYEHTLHTIDAAPKVLHLRLAALFHDISKPQTRQVMEDKATFYGHESIGAKVAVKVLRRLRYSTEVIENVRTLVEKHMFTTGVTDKGLRRLVRRVGKELIFDLLDLRRADVEAQAMGGTTEDVDQFEADIRAELERKPPFSVTDLEIDGRDIMELFNIPQSPLIGAVLNHLLEIVLDDPSENVREKLIEYARVYIENRQ
ncbi:MAG: HDIG domain-containing metalloprotein [Candidatus Zixiibacteriota bacterium]